MRNASGQQGETSKVKMIDSEKKVNRNTSNKIFGEHIRRYHILLFHYYVILPYKVKRTSKIRGRNIP